jgi:hypothetical protein
MAWDGFEIGNARGALFRESLTRKRKLRFEESAPHELLEFHAVGVNPPNTQPVVVRITVTVFAH